MIKLRDVGTKLTNIHKKVVKETVDFINKLDEKEFLVLASVDYGSVYRCVVYQYLERLWKAEPGLFVLLYGFQGFDGFSFSDQDLDDLINATISEIESFPPELKTIIDKFEALRNLDESEKTIVEATKYYFGDLTPLMEKISIEGY